MKRPRTLQAGSPRRALSAINTASHTATNPMGATGYGLESAIISGDTQRIRASLIAGA